MSVSIWRDHRFVRFFSSVTISNAGDWFDAFALQLILVRHFHASPIELGFLILLYFLPGIVFGSFAGVLADRLSRRLILSLVAFVSAILTLGIYLSGSVGIIFVLLFFRSLIGSFDGPAQSAYIKSIAVGNQQLLSASAYQSIIFQLCKVLGPMLGAVLLIWYSPRVCLLINAVSFVLSALVFYTLPNDKVTPEDHHKEVKTPFIQQLKAGAVFVWQHPVLRALNIIVFIWMIMALARLGQMAIFLEHIVPKDPNALGWYLGFDGLGSVISGTIMSRFKEVRHPRRFFAFGFFLLFCGVTATSFYQPAWSMDWLYLCAFVLGIGSGFGTVLNSYLIRRETPEDKIGTVSGVIYTLQQIGLAIGSIGGGAVIMLMGVRHYYMSIAVVMLCLGVLSWLLLKHKGPYNESTV